MALHWLDSFNSFPAGVSTSGGLLHPWRLYTLSWPFGASTVASLGRDGTVGIANSGYSGTLRDGVFDPAVVASWPVPDWPGAATHWYDTLSDGGSVWVVGGVLRLNFNGLGTYAHEVRLIGLTYMYLGVPLDNFYLYARPDGSISYSHLVLDESNGTRKEVEFGRTKAMVWRANVPIYVEVKSIIGSSGSVEIRVNDETVMLLTGIDNRVGYKNPTTGKISYFNRASAVNLAGINIFPKAIGPIWDDIYLLDGYPGVGLPNNDFLGNVRSARLAPSADFVTEMTAVPAGQSWSCVDELISNGADYVYGEHNKKDLYEFQDPPAGTYVAVNQNIYARRVGAPYSIEEGGFNVFYGELTIDRVVSSGGTEDAVEIDKQFIGSAYQRITRIVPVDPNTGVPWTQSGLAAAKFGYRVREPSNPVSVPV